MEIRQATMRDFDGIRALLKANHIDYINEEEKADGFVTTNMTDRQLEELIVKENGVTIATDQGKVLAFAFAASWDFWKEWPFFAHMIEKLPEFTFNGLVLCSKNCYQYGPVCLDKSIRGTGVFEQVFYASLAHMKPQYTIMTTFINQINHRSFAAHTKKAMMEQAGTFQFNGNDYYLMACLTILPKGKDATSVRRAALQSMSALLP